ncbi:MAG: family 43 glycosylhydrolase [Planctomycetales bacterium]|nr:family 43 glycosylhydrolase [Planctomycetales bacterium]
MSQLPTKRRLVRAIAAAAAMAAFAQPVLGQLTGQLIVHDPSRIYEEDGRYFLYHTGNFVGSKYSDDLVHWQNGPTAFAAVPAWADAEVSGNDNNMWAPDLFKFGNEYRLYYSLSSFGSQDSVIGMATNSTLDFNNPNFGWVDQGLVIKSEQFAPYNTIDPAVFLDDATNRMWLTFGSYWNGIYITELDPATGKRISPTSPTLNIARNPGSPVNAIEAPYLTEHDGEYYLFVNWDACCQGSESTYNIRVGRSSSPTGPFRDRTGLAMTNGGGELFLGSEGAQIGPGHFSEFEADGVEYFSYHYYDGRQAGVPKLNIEELAWTVDGWPIPASDLGPGDFNGDGAVNGADLVLWNDFFGSQLAGAELLDWQRNYSLPSSAAASGAGVPEPPAWSLAMFVTSLGALRLSQCGPGGRPAAVA